jgi:hypothetical protein
MNKSVLQKNILKFFIFHFSLLIIVGCGYKPSSQVIKNTFEDTVYVEVIVDRAEPENAPFVKDEMNRLIYTRFKGRVVSKEQAESQIHISYSGSSFSPLAYDQDGYVTRYRVNVRVHFDMITKKGRLKKDITAIHEADIHASSLASSSLRTEAIRKGLEKALDEFMAYVSALSVSNKKK